MSYLSDQKSHWETGYFAPNVESFVFRFYGRTLSPEFGMTGRNGERILDFGCGQGAAVSYFQTLGFNSFGADISEIDIAAARDSYPAIADNFATIDSKPSEDRLFFGGNFECIISIQTLYYLADPELNIAVENLARNMKKGAVLYVTMMSPEHYFYKFSTEAENGLRAVEYVNPRRSKRSFYINFMESEDDLVATFPQFEPVHVGFYSEKYRNDEGVRHHYTFVGVKR